MNGLKKKIIQKKRPTGRDNFILIIVGGRMKKIITRLALVVLAIISVSCSGDIGESQINQKNDRDPDFVLFDMFHNEPGLDEIWDVMDQNEMNLKMADMINTDKASFVTFSELNSEIMQEAGILPAMLKDVRTMIALILSTDVRFKTSSDLQLFYNQNPEDYKNIMFALAERLRRDSAEPGMTDSILAIARKVTGYMVTQKTPAELQDFMNDLIQDINDLEREDFVLLTKNLGKMMAAASYPMYIKNPNWSDRVDGKFGSLETDYSSMTGYTNSGLGNIVKGNFSLMTGLRDRVGENIGTDGRQLVYDLVSDLRKTLLEPANTAVIKDLVYNMEDYFTVGGAVYGTTNTTNTDVTTNMYNTNSTGLYSDAEISTTLKETLAAMSGLLLRDDRPGALTSTAGSKSYALDRFISRLKNMGVDWKNSKLEESLFDIVRVDAFGRDRRTDSSAYATSFIEEFLVLGGVTNNLGWKHGGETNEINNSNAFADLGNLHGHGEPTNYMTLNDSLFSITSQNDSLASIGTFDLAFDGPKNSSHGFHRDHLFRSRGFFTDSNKDNYKFDFDLDYPALDFAAGATVGDLGLPDGGNKTGTVPAKNGYRPYNGNGIDEKSLAGWTLGWVARACFEGEGPYYYKNPSAPTKTINGKTYSVYMRPNGRIYAYVNTDDTANPVFIYPSGTWDSASGTEIQDLVKDPLDNDVEYMATPIMTHSKITGVDIDASNFSTILASKEMGITIGDLPEVTVTFQYRVSPLYWTAAQIQAKIADALTAAGIPTTTATCSIVNTNYIRLECAGTLFLRDKKNNPLKFIFGLEGLDGYSAEMFLKNPTASTMTLSVDSITDRTVSFTADEELTAASIVSKMNTALGSPSLQRVYSSGNSIFVVVDPNATGPAIHLANATGTPLQTVFNDARTDVSIGTGASGIQQRQNRYRSTWRTDYYMVTSEDGTKRYTPGDMSGNATGPGFLMYEEIIPENDPKRACASQEEAIFRNYQWVMTEKKMVLVIPMWLIAEALGGLTTQESVVYQIIEGHGFAGVASCRKLRDNGVWAKANTGGMNTNSKGSAISSYGKSNVPGDYRLDVRVAIPNSSDPLQLINSEKVYTSTLGWGPATPSIAYNSLAPLYRLGFPLSPLLDQNSTAFASGYGDVTNMNFEHYMVGSKQFTVSSSDSIWNHRNMVMPVLAALVNVIHESATKDNHTITNFLDGTLPLIKPLFFFNVDANGSGVATNSFLPRLNGTGTFYNYEHAKMLIPEQFITGAIYNDGGADPTAWFGGWAVADFYMAKPMTTIFSTLVDRKGPAAWTDSAARNSYCATGLIPILTQYDHKSLRSDDNHSPTRLISNIVDQLVKLGDSQYDDKAGIDYNTASLGEFDESQFVNFGTRRKILYGMEQILTAPKMSKGRYISILQGLSNGDISNTRQQKIPEWIFEKRDVDIDMDELLARVVGYGDPNGRDLTGKGLAAYPDDKPAYTDWADLDDSISDLSEITDYVLLQNDGIGDLLDAADVLLSKKITDNEIASIMYTSGKLFARYDNNLLGSKWVWQGELATDTPANPDTDFSFLYRMIKNYLPLIHQEVLAYEAQKSPAPATGDTYMATLKVLNTTLKEDGLMEFLMDIPTLSANAEELFNEIYEFLGENFVTGIGTTGGGAMWVTLSDLMTQLAQNVGTTTPEMVSDIYNDYGFQQND